LVSTWIWGTGYECPVTGIDLGQTLGAMEFVVCRVRFLWLA
jgi:hypothetical protein